MKHTKSRSIIGVVLSSVLLSSCAAGSESGGQWDGGETQGSTVPSLGPAWQERLVQGPSNPEDLVAVPGVDAILVSSMPDDLADSSNTGHLRLFDPVTTDVTEVWPGRDTGQDHDEDTFADCPAPDLSLVAPHGISLEEREGESDRLYVVNHGGRESIEVFTVEPAGAKDLELTWVGCAELPGGTMGNGVAADPESDGFYVTHFFDPSDMMSGFERAFEDESTGYVLHWTPGDGWRKLPGSEMSTPNGLALSPDGSKLFVASWGSRDIRSFDLQGESAPQVVELDFMPDNLRWGDEGALLLTGQFIDEFEEFAAARSGEGEPASGYSVLEINVEDFGVSEVAAGDPEGFVNPSVALEFNGEIWVGSVTGNELVRLTPQ